MSEIKISVVIPVVNEAKNLAFLIPYLKHHGAAMLHEIIIVDGNSDDGSAEIAQKLGALVLKSTIRSRAVQMNAGAKIVGGQILYFVHADTSPPACFATDILEEIDKGYVSGCYRFKFDSDKWYLKINNFFTRFNYIWCRGGDQSLFITKEVFDQLKGFDEQHEIMEEYRLIERLQSRFNFIIMPKNILVSARKYDGNSWLRVMWANFMAFRMYRNNTDSKIIKERYYKMLRYNSL
jgi:rSAM/selenodomain-associated transferase 2